MILGFEIHTAELNEQELKLVPILVNSFLKHRGAENAIKAPDIVEAMKKYLYDRNIKIKFTDARLRKIVNHIRTQGIIPLIATSVGYYVSYNVEEIEAQIKSLKQRAASIDACANGLIEFL